jgi:hypothetical protein
MKPPYADNMLKATYALDKLLQGYGFALVVFEPASDTSDGHLSFVSNAETSVAARCLEAIVQNHTKGVIPERTFTIKDKLDS